MRESTIGGTPVLVLREAKPKPPAGHRCPVEHGDTASKNDNGAIIQCECGKRYRCRPSRGLADGGNYTWVRRWLPRPPRQQGWPKS